MRVPEWAALRWSRSDQLVLEGLLWAVPAVTALSVLGTAVRAVRGEAIESTGYLPEQLVTAVDPVTGSLSGTVVVEDPSTAQYAWALVPGLVVVLLTLAAAMLLLGVARSLRVGEPFTVANARRVTSVGVLVAVGGVILPFVHSIGHHAVIEPLVPDNGSVTWVVDAAIWPVAVGLLIAFVAEVFARGARLREDVDGLV